MDKMKKGYLFTLGTFLILSVLLALAISLNSALEKSKENITIISAIDRVSELSSSVEKGFKEIIDIYADFDVEIEENSKVNITISENISRVKEDWGIDLDENIQNYRDFIQSQDNNVQLNVAGFDEELPLEIRPYNITYTRDWATGQVRLTVEPQEINFDGFEIVVNAHNREINKLQSSAIKKDSFIFKVTAIDNFGFLDVEDHKIDPDKNNEISVKFVDGNQVKLTIKDNELEIWTNTLDTITITLKMVGFAKTSEKARVVYPGVVYNVTFSDIIKLGNIEFM